MIEDYDGADLVDATDEGIGTVERSYVDDTGRVRFVEVKIGGLRAKHRLVPMDQVERADDALRAPFGKDVVEGSPDTSSAGDTLEGEMLDAVRAYYARSRDPGSSAIETAGERAAVPVNEAQSRAPATSEPNGDEEIADKAERAVEQVRENLPGAHGDGAGDQGQAGPGAIGQVRDMGDVIEIPIVEEELIKRPVVKEVLRIRKSSVTEQQPVSAELRKEEIEVDREGDPSG